MPFNGSGSFSPYTPGNPAVSGTTISSTAFNNTVTDFATGLSNAMTRDGQSPATANIPMGGKKITGLGDGSAATDAATVGQTVTALAASSGSSLVGHLPSGTGAVATTVQTKLRESVSVKDFGAKGDGTTDDTSAFAAFLTSVAGKSGFIPNPSVGYKITSALTIPSSTRLYGEDKFSTRIFPSGSFTLFTMMNGSVLENLYLDGNSQTGIGINITGTEGQQRIDNCKITDFDNTCINFAATTAGSYFSSTNCLVYRKSAAYGSGKYAVVIADAIQLLAVPRRFVNFESGGTPSFSFGGANDLHMTNSWLGDLLHSVNTSGCLISNCRIGTTQNFTMLGGQNSIVGCDVYPIITLGTGAGGCTIGPGAFNSGPPIDASGTATNLLYHIDSSFTPTWTSTGTQPAIGNGTLVGNYNRQGNVVTVYAQITAGSTTTFGTGIYRISLPANAPVVNVQAQMCGNVRASHGGLLYFGTVSVPGSSSGQYGEFQRDTVNGFTFNTPATWSSGDVFYVQFSYRV